MNHIYLTRRNLLTLLSKLDRAAYGSATARTIMKLDAKHPRYPSTPTTITAVEDHDYYTDRRPGPVTELETIHTQIPWLQVIDEALVVSHQGVANFSDSFEVAQKKLGDLIKFEVEIATNPIVNGGFSLQPVEPKLPTPQTFFEDLSKVSEAKFFGDK
jgi:hypothetical protein